MKNERFELCPLVADRVFRPLWPYYGFWALLPEGTGQTIEFYNSATFLKIIFTIDNTITIFIRVNIPFFFFFFFVGQAYLK